MFDQTLIRVCLILGSFITAGYILRRVRHAKVQIEDTIFWLMFSAALLILAVVHRVRAKKKVLALTPGERVRLLNELAEPFGFAYLPAEDIFTSRLDAWQRDKGYEAKYDTMAVGAGMVIDAFPVYFNYE